MGSGYKLAYVTECAPSPEGAGAVISSIPALLTQAVEHLLLQNPVLRFDGWTISSGEPAAILVGRTSTVQVFLAYDPVVWPYALTTGACGRQFWGSYHDDGYTWWTFYSID